MDFGEDQYLVADQRGCESVVHNTAHKFLSSQHGIITDPRLRLNKPWKILAMYEFDMAISGKIFLKFPYKFWPTGPGTQYFLFAHERRGYYPIWKHFEIEYPGSNILLVIVTDDEARRIEQQTDAETEAETMEVLQKMFSNDIPKPTGILVPRWWTNGFFRGSFSNWLESIGATLIN